MKTAQGGYKAMIRDRVPQTVDFALKWCKAKTSWVEHVYENFVWFLIDKKDKDQQVRALLGLSKLNRNFEFDETINWDNLSKEDREYWKNISKWVHFFEREMIPMVEIYETLKIKGHDEEYIKQYICTSKFGTLPQTVKDKLYTCWLNHIKTYYV